MAVSPACRPYVPQLSPFIDGELSPDDRVMTERHVSSCADCTARVADLRAQSGLLRVGYEMLADDVDFRAFTQQVMAKAKPEPLPPLERLPVVVYELFTHRWPLMVGAVASVAVAGAAVVGIGLFNRTDRLPAGYGSRRPIIQTISSDANSHTAPLLLTMENGDPIVWFVDHIHPGDESQGGAMKVDSEAQPGNKGGQRAKGGDL